MEYANAGEARPMRWIDIIRRDSFCIYCGGTDYGLMVISLDGKETTSANSAACCKFCYKSNARKILGARGARVMKLEVARRNARQGVPLEKVEKATFTEKVDLGLIRFKLPQRYYLPYEISGQSDFIEQEAE